jgi:hypothetical protein
MSPTSYRTAPPRVNREIVTPRAEVRKGWRSLRHNRQAPEIQQKLHA